jgi:hypothetical protein
MTQPIQSDGETIIVSTLCHALMLTVAYRLLCTDVAFSVLLNR